MSVVDSMVIDGIALTEDKNGIVLLITDHLDWSEEYQHLMILQEKINMYLGYLEEKQYGDMYTESVHGKLFTQPRKIVVDVNFMAFQFQMMNRTTQLLR